MNTCKATLRVLAAHRLYVIIYLVFIGIMMFAISWSALTSNTDVGDSYEPGKPVVAVVDRDRGRGDIATAMQDYLRTDNEIITVEDDPEALQQAVASNYVDLIVIVPHGYADAVIASAGHGEPPAVETITSYTSGAGAMASMGVNGFLSLTRTTLIGESAEATAGVTEDATSTAVPTVDQLAEAAKSVADVADDPSVNPAIAVDHADRTAEDTSSTNLAAMGFGTTMKTALYPLLLAMVVCTALVTGVFNAGETKRRLDASPQRSSSLGMQRMATMGAFSLVVAIGYLIIAFALMLAAGHDPFLLPPAGVAMTACTTGVYALMAVACGFLLGECGVSETMANGIANVFGLLTLFTSGTVLPLSMMPSVMITVGKFLPGSWYCQAIDHALGIGTAAAGVSVGDWASCLGLVALFGVAFICLGLGVGRFRRSRPATGGAAVTQLAES